FTRAVVVVIVEPRFSDRNHLAMTRVSDQIGDREVEFLVRVVRKPADRAIDARKALGDGEHLGIAPDPGRGRDQRSKPGRAGARDQAIKLARDIRTVPMAVRAAVVAMQALTAVAVRRE